MQKSQRFFAVTFVFFTLNSVQAQSLDSLIIKAAPQFSGQVAIVKNDSVIYSFSKGWLNYPMQISMKKNNLMEIGELSSLFTKEAIYQLIASKKINIDSSVATYLPRFPYKNITVKHLLDQSSGLPSNYIKLYHRYIFDDQNNKTKDKTINNSDILEILEKFKPALEFNPGEKSVICNTNDIMLASLIEVMYFKSYEEVINEMILNQHKSLSIVANSDIEETPLLSRAYGHKKINATELSVEESLTDLGFKYSDATMGHHHIYANAESLAKYFSLTITKFGKYPITYLGHETGYNSLLSFNNGMTIVILSNTSDEGDAELILKVLSEP